MLSLRPLTTTGDYLRFRLVPNWKIAARQWHHFHKAAGRNFVCSRILNKDRKWEGSCPACDFWRDNWNELRGDIKPTEKYYIRAVERKEFEIDNEIRLLTIGKTVYKSVLDHIVGDTGKIEAKGDVTHPVTGRDFTIDRSKKMPGPGTMFPVYNVICHEPSPLGFTGFDPLDFSFVDEIAALDDSEEIEAIINKLYKVKPRTVRSKTKWRSIDDVGQS